MRQNKIRVGLMMVSLPPEKSTEPPEVESISEEVIHTAEKKLEESGIDVVRIPGQMQSENASIQAVESLEEKDVGCIVIMIGSWIYVPLVIAPVRRLTIPFLIWGFPDLLVGSLVPSCITHGSLDEMGIKHKFVYGSPDDKDTLDQIIEYARAAMVVKRLNNMRYGLFGGRCMYMYTGMPDLVQVKQILGVETDHISQFELISRAQLVEERKVLNFLKEFKETYKNIEPPDEVLLKSIRLYFALKEVIKERSLDFIGLKCMPELVTNYVSGCLAVAYLNNEGIVVGCEADTNGALSMEILHLLADEPVGFADVRELRKREKKVRLENCGSITTAFAISQQEVSWGLQYKFIGPAQGATPIFMCKPGRITLARLARIKGEYVMHIASGEAYLEDKEKMKETRDRWPQMFFKLDGDPEDFLQNCRSNHQHWVYGDYRTELIEICEMLGVKPILT